ncbi:pre-toxin TG domain-containing protein [Geobacillus sp. FSL W8-0032]|nr:pre-toxin TG domain-containing protein [Geobacillus icigianus]
MAIFICLKWPQNCRTRDEQKLNEAEELLYRTAAAMRQADETLADNMKEFGLELLGWYDVQRVFGEYDPIAGERLSVGDRLLAGGMLLASMVPPAKGAGMAGKAAIKGTKAMEAASVLSKTKHVVRYDKIKAIFETIYQQVVKAPFAETARLFKKQWDDLVESVASTAWQPAYAGVGPASRVWMNEARNEVKDATLHMTKKIEGEAIDRIPKSSNSFAKGIGKYDNGWDMSRGGGEIGGRRYSEHSLERMAPDTIQVRAELEKRALEKGLKPGTKEFKNFVDPRGVPPMVVEDTIRNVKPTAGNRPNTLKYDGKDVTVITNTKGDVITVIPK